MENQTNWFAALVKRLQASTPSFFKKVVYFGITLGTIGTGLIAVEDQLPAFIGEIARYMVTAGVVAGVVAGATVKDPSKI